MYISLLMYFEELVNKLPICKLMTHMSAAKMKIGSQITSV